MHPRKRRRIRNPAALAKNATTGLPNAIQRAAGYFGNSGAGIPACSTEGISRWPRTKTFQPWHRFRVNIRTMEAPASQRPTELCGYAVVETLAPDATYLAIGPGGRGVALKRLDPDCLYRDLLHPDVRDRLSRVRELAHNAVANLIGVGKAGADAWLIWEYLEGQTLASYAIAQVKSQQQLAALARELVLTVESLHLQGIIHGAIHARNVIIAPDASVRLTHISPLLYEDPADDAEAILETFNAILIGRNEQDSALGLLLAEAGETKMPLRMLATRLAALADARSPDYEPAAHIERRERRIRKRAVFAALVVAVAGIAIAYEVWRRAGAPGAEMLPRWLK